MKIKNLFEDDICATGEIRPQLPDDGRMLSEQDLFSLYTDEVTKRLIVATKDFAEKNNSKKATMYRRLKLSPLNY